MSQLSRRGFLKLSSLSAGGIVLATSMREWPFRVYSFPSNIVCVNKWDVDAWLFRNLTTAMRIPRKRDLNLVPPWERGDRAGKAIYQLRIGLKKLGYEDVKL